MFSGPENLVALEAPNLLPEKPLEVKNSLIVFVENELVIYDFNRANGWFVGDSINNIKILKYSSFAKVDPEIHR